MGIQLPYELPLIQIEQVLEKTAANQSSMLQDLQRRAPTEIDQINGAIVRYGEMCGVPTPINQTLVQLLKAKLKII
jgi:2-dehydropantoate 2-reductase